MEAPIYIPPDARGEDPFRRDRKRSIRRGLIAGGSLVLVAGAVAGALVLFGSEGVSSFDPEPGPLSEALRRTDWRLPRDRATGFRLLETALRPSQMIDGAAIGPDGTVVIATHEEPSAELWIVVWREGRWRRTAAGVGRAVTRVTVDPEGNVWAAVEGRLLVDRRTGPAEVLPGSVSSGYSVDAFAFDPRSQRSAVMLAGGRIRTGLRPLVPERLHEVTLPPRMRPRVMAYDDEGQLVLGGDAGAIAISGGEGWDEETLPTNGRVVAFGLAADGDLIAAQANGHVFRRSGSTWSRVGQLSSAPVAVGELPERGITAVTADARIWATLGRDEFSELPGYVPPQGFAGAFGGQIAGANVLAVSRERMLVYDAAGDPFDSSADDVARGGGTVGRLGCAPIGPASVGTGIPAPLWRCDERIMRVHDGRLVDAPTVRVAGGDVQSSALANALENQARSRTWLGDRLLQTGASLSGPAVMTLDPGSGMLRPWTQRPVEEGQLLSVAASGSDLWTLPENGPLRHEAIAGGAPAGTSAIVATREQLFALGAGDETIGVLVRALGGGRALVMQRGAMRFHFAMADVAAPGTLRAIDYPAGILHTPQVVQTGGRVLVVDLSRLFEITPDAQLLPWTLPAGARLERSMWRPIAFDTALGRDRAVVLLGSVPAGRERASALLTCRNRSCSAQSLQSLGDVESVLAAEDGRLLLALSRGRIALEEPR